MNTKTIPLARALGCVLACIACIGAATAQQKPAAYSLDLETGRYAIDAATPKGFYDLERVDTLNVQLPGDWWERIQDGEVLGELVYRGERYDSIEFEIKGSSSDHANPTQKKSFELRLDEHIGGQDIDGYDETNLHCGIFDESHVREATFHWIGRHYLPSPKSNYVYLTINGKNWGAYTNTQEQDKRFLREWFVDESGPRIRGESPFGRIGADESCTPPPANDGRQATPSALHYLGDDPGVYKNFYSPKGDFQPEDWNHLINFVDALNNLPDEELSTALWNSLDVDAALWFLAHEILLGDEDGYVYKTQSDYLLYHDPAANRMVPLEYDGNSSLSPKSVEWSPLHRSYDACVPLVDRLLNHPEFRARYLAHCRTILSEYFDPSLVLPQVDAFVKRIDIYEQNDPVGDEIYPYDQFKNGVGLLKEHIVQRHRFLRAHPLLQASGVKIGKPVFITDGGVAPEAGESVALYVDVAGTRANTLRIWHATGLGGKFQCDTLYDDGLHGDRFGGDGRFGGSLPGYPVDTYVRYYIEAFSGDGNATATYLPRGAEHDVFIYRVAPRVSTSDPLRLNELMASNDTTAADEAGQFADWIELYNSSDEIIDISNYSLSDAEGVSDKWNFPSGTFMAPLSYLIVWADKDEEDGPLHANFKLQREEELLLLSDPAGVLIDSVHFGEQTTDLSYARATDGFGAWRIAQPTFNVTNVIEEPGSESGETGEEGETDPDKGGGTTDGETNPDGTPAGNDAGGAVLDIDTSPSDTATTVSTFDARHTNSLTLTAYPNPSRSGQSLTIHASGAASGSGEFLLVDALGRTVLKRSISLSGSERYIEVALPHLPAGYYSGVLTGGFGQGVVRILMQ